MAALDDSPRPGKEPEITLEARAWLVSLACQKAKDVGYPHELWTTRLLARHAREHAPNAGHVCLARIAQGTVCKFAEQEVKPHKVRYYLERRDPAFEAKMAEVLCVYQEVAILRAVESDAVKACADPGSSVRDDPGTANKTVAKPAPNVAFISYDENTRAIAGDRQHRAGLAAGGGSAFVGCTRSRIQTSRDIEPAGRHRPAHGTSSTPASKIAIARASSSASSRSLIPPILPTRLCKIILDNHSAHVSKETNKWLAEQRDGRLRSFVFTPKHVSPGSTLSKASILEDGALESCAASA